MFRTLVYLLAFTAPLWSARNYQQTDTSAAQCSQAEAIACSGVAAAEAESVGREAIDSGTAGTSETAVTISNDTPEIVCFWYESEDVNDTSWAAGTWSVRLDVTTTADANWTRTDVCRVTSDCSSVEATVGSATHSISLNATGVTSDVDVTGSAQAGAAASDLWLIVLACLENVAHGNAAFGVTPSQLIDTPLAALAAGKRRVMTMVIGD